MLILRFILVGILLIPSLALAESTSRKQVLLDKFHSQADSHRIRIRVLANLKTSRRGNTSSGFEALVKAEQALHAPPASLFRRLTNKWRQTRKDRTPRSSSPSSNPRKEQLLSAQLALAARGRSILNVLQSVGETSAAVASNQLGSPPVTPALALRNGVDFIKAKVKESIPEKLDQHAWFMRNKELSRAIHQEHGSLSGLDLKRRLPGLTAEAMSEVLGHLKQIETNPSHLWMSRFVWVVNSYKHHEHGASKALRDLWWMLHDEHGGKGGNSGSKMEEKYLKTLSARLIAHPERKAARALPDSMPPLPRSRLQAIRRLVARARREGSLQRQLLFLETEAMKLRSSESDKRLALGKALTEYLAEYKKPWLNHWLIERLYQFHDQPEPRSWILTSHVEFNNIHRSFSNSEKREVMKQLDQAWKIITNVIHPDLLKRLPEPIVLVESNRTREGHDGITLKLGPRSQVSDILHEFGHHLEGHAGVGLFALAQSMRQQRAFTRGGLKPRANNAKEFVYSGSYHEEYAGRHYSWGPTEMVSKGLEKFSDLNSLREFFLQDGQHALRLIAALQHPETLGVPF